MNRFGPIALGLLLLHVGAISAVEIARKPQKSLCAPGYQQRPGSRCIPLLVPENAHIDFSGHDWECNRGYRKTDEVCKRVRLPDAGAAPDPHRKIVLPAECHDHRDTGRGGRSPDLLRRCD
jgi:hypothetical protein